MATLEEIPGNEAVLRNRIENQGKFHHEVSAELQQLWCSELSCMSVRRYCTQHDIHRTARVQDTSLDQMVLSNVRKVSVTSFIPRSMYVAYLVTNYTIG